MKSASGATRKRKGGYKDRLRNNVFTPRAFTRSPPYPPYLSLSGSSGWLRATSWGENRTITNRSAQAEVTTSAIELISENSSTVTQICLRFVFTWDTLTKVSLCYFQRSKIQYLFSRSNLPQWRNIHRQKIMKIGLTWLRIWFLCFLVEVNREWIVSLGIWVGS